MKCSSNRLCNLGCNVDHIPFLDTDPWHRHIVRCTNIDYKLHSSSWTINSGQLNWKNTWSKFSADFQHSSEAFSERNRLHICHPQQNLSKSKCHASKMVSNIVEPVLWVSIYISHRYNSHHIRQQFASKPHFSAFQFEFPYHLTRESTNTKRNASTKTPRTWKSNQFHDDCYPNGKYNWKCHPFWDSRAFFWVEESNEIGNRKLSRNVLLQWKYAVNKHECSQMPSLPPLLVTKASLSKLMTLFIPNIYKAVLCVDVLWSDVKPHCGQSNDCVDKAKVYIEGSVWWCELRPIHISYTMSKRNWSKFKSQLNEWWVKSLFISMFLIYGENKWVSIQNFRKIRMKQSQRARKHILHIRLYRTKSETMESYFLTHFLPSHKKSSDFHETLSY